MILFTLFRQKDIENMCEKEQEFSYNFFTNSAINSVSRLRTEDLPYCLKKFLFHYTSSSHFFLKCNNELLWEICIGKYICLNWMDIAEMCWPNWCYYSKNHLLWANECNHCWILSILSLFVVAEWNIHLWVQWNFD